MLVNDFIPVELFGRWNDLVKTVSNHNTTLRNSDESPTKAPTFTEIQKEMVNDKPPKETNNPEQSTSTATVKEALPLVAPREEDFGIPKTETEYEAMVERM